ncbi:MAG: hypothetical protein KAS36_07475 [Anaerolineales bacterium]|nr:hypothetical protein [Anaerolineales bacterium]
MIEGHTRTSVDWLRNKSFPVWFSPNIQVGHFVKAQDGTEAKIVRITHAAKDAKPYLIIEVWEQPKT